MKQSVSSRRLQAVAVLCALLWCANSGVAAEEKDVDLKIERVALFKNGLGFVTSSATILRDANTIAFGQMPVPAYGTFWVSYPEDMRVRGLVTSLEEREERVSPQNLAQLLLANPGTKVTIRTGPEGKEVVAGVIIPPATDAEGTEPPNPYFMEGRRRRDPNRANMPFGAAGNVVLIQTATGMVALNQGSIHRADFETGQILPSVPDKQKVPTIRMELDQSAKGKEVSVSYLARGITWVPSYLIDLSDPENASFSAHALIINELTNFRNVKLDLVTGFPNIKFGEVLSPIAMSQNLEEFLNSLASGRTEDRSSARSGPMVQQRAVMSNISERYSGFDAPRVPAYSTAAEGMVSEDLFLYPVEDFSLKKGETAWVPLFTAELPYKHIYTWKIADSLPQDRWNRPDPNQEQVESAPEVWHSCRLTNNLEFPLTTAAAEFTKDGGLTGQDICYYTAPGAETTIRINRAMSILAEEDEIEVERQANAANFHGYQYDLVKVRGELKLRSRMDKPVSVEITKELSGEVMQSTPPAKDVATAKGLRQVNPKHVLTWDIELNPGDEQKLSYSHQLYVRD